MAYDAARGASSCSAARSNSRRHVPPRHVGVGRHGWTEAHAGDEPVRRAPGPRDGLRRARARIVLFGGGDGSDLGDTWEWDGTCVDSTSPPTVSRRAAIGHAMAYDTARGRVVLFGGFDGQTGSLGDTWEWDGVAWSAPTIEAPSARAYATTAYDARRGRVVLFGGLDSSFVPLADTWEWDGAAWQHLTPAVAPPPAIDHALIYDAGRGRAALIGGLDPGAVWEWDGGGVDRHRPDTRAFAAGGRRDVFDRRRARARRPIRKVTPRPGNGTA